MKAEGLGVYIAVISHERPMNVRKLLSQIKVPATFYVGHGEKRYYEMGGATSVIESGKLCESRNAALRDAADLGLPCLQMSDDVTKFSTLENEKAKEITFVEAVKTLKREMMEHQAQLAGIAPTNNPFFAKHRVNLKGFILGDFFINRDTEIFFDENLRLKEDYDFTLQHLKKNGKVCRVDWLMANFKHRNNSGGAVAYRTNELEKKSIEYLKSKWGSIIGSNPRGDTEIRLKL